jgi:hypothetical protein
MTRWRSSAVVNLRCPLSFQHRKSHIPPNYVVDRGVSYVEGYSALDFPFIHGTWRHALPQNKFSNINKLKLYH